MAEEVVVEAGMMLLSPTPGPCAWTYLNALAFQDPSQTDCIPLDVEPTRVGRGTAGEEA